MTDFTKSGRRNRLANITTAPSIHRSVVVVSLVKVSLDFLAVSDESGQLVSIDSDAVDADITVLLEDRRY